MFQWTEWIFPDVWPLANLWFPSPVTLEWIINFITSVESQKDAITVHRKWHWRPSSSQMTIICVGIGMLQYQIVGCHAARETTCFKWAKWSALLCNLQLQKIHNLWRMYRSCMWSVVTWWCICSSFFIYSYFFFIIFGGRGIRPIFQTHIELETFTCIIETL